MTHLPLKRALGFVVVLATLAGAFAVRADEISAKQQLRAASPEAADPRFRQGLLWRVEVKGGAAPNYLFGTLHWDDERVLKLPEEVERAFQRSKRYAPELVMDDAAVRRFRSAMLTREPQLPAVLGEALYGKVEPLLDEHGIPRDARPRLKPWAALLTLLQPRERPGIILDNLLLMQANRRNMPIDALESVDEQIAVFDEMPQETQLELLRQVEANYYRIQDAVRPVAQAYLQRDLDAVWKLNVEVMAGAALDDPHNRLFIERVLFERNQRMAQRLAPLLRHGGVFAAFGALHLYGDRGVPSLLEKQGFTVRRLY